MIRNEKIHKRNDRVLASFAAFASALAEFMSTADASLFSTDLEVALFLKLYTHIRSTSNANRRPNTKKIVS